ncbi:MAG TPA: FAD-dependent monooxygenase, partial [Casimicrobiaceae bacterium]|nr:FAD-dependent monooxygenase [Casimicrobiaceae bacterium]
MRPAELSGGATRHWPVIVAGAGPVGLTAAIDLAQRGIDVLV